MGRTWKILTFLGILAACHSDYGVTKIKDKPIPGESVPNITVEPAEINFGALNAEAESDSQTIYFNSFE